MTNFLIPYTFIPGTKAKAEEVNANFSAVKDELETKAVLNGDEGETFLVAEAVLDAHAVNKSQLDLVNTDLTQKFKDLINSDQMKFCVKSGNLNASGNPDLFNYTGLNIYFKVGDGENYPKLVAMNGLGETVEKTTLNNLKVDSSGTTYSIVSNSNNAISNGAVYPAEDVFDNDSSTFFMSTQYSSLINGNAAIGQAGLTQKISKIKIWQGFYNIPNFQTYHKNVTSIKIQISSDGVSWIDLQTVATPDEYWNTWQLIELEDYTLPETVYSMRLLANSDCVYSGNNGWIVNEVQFLAQDDEGSINFSDDATFNLFINNESNDVIFYENTIYVKDSVPTIPVLNDIWFDTSVYPLVVKIYSASGWLETDLIPIGKVTVNGNSIISGETFAYNNNNFIINNTKSGRTLVVNFLMPNLSQGVSKTAGQIYQATSTGWIYVEGSNTFTLQVSANSDVSSAMNFNLYKSDFIPISKGMYYKATDTITMTFYPCKGGV